MQHHGERKKSTSNKDNLRLKSHIAEQDYVIKSLKKQLKEARHNTSCFDPLFCDGTPHRDFKGVADE